jgi:hypothetical protein
MTRMLDPPFIVFSFPIELPRVTLWSGLQVAALWFVGFGS